MPEETLDVKSDVKGPVSTTSPHKMKTVGYETTMREIVDRGDTNHDGKLTRAELKEFLSSVDINKNLVKQYKKIMMLVSVAAIVIIIALAIVTGLAIEYSKESHVKNKLFVDKDGSAVQCASDEIEISNGLLTNKKNKGGVRTLKALAVSHPLNSKVPDKYLQKLVEFTVNVDGQDQYVKVDSFRRVPDVTMECGSYVLLSTNIGEFKLDTTHIWLNGVRVQADGSFGLGSFAKGRKLKAIDLLAFYDEVDDIEFECTLSWNDADEQVKKPSKPTLPMSYIGVNHHPMGMVNSKLADVCTSMLGANARKTKPGASDGRDSLIAIDHILITETQQVKVSYFPNHPLQKLVAITNSSTVTQYQLYKNNPTRLFCRATASGDDTEMSLESLHYLGTHTHENVPIRKWAVSALNETQRTLPQEAKETYGLSDHSYVEYWDTDDEQNLPFYVGMADSEKPSPYSSTFFKSVKVGLDDAAVQTWIATELHGSSDKGACRESRKLLKHDDEWLQVPKMIEPTEESTTDVDFYVAQVLSGSTIDEVEFQDVSYRGYWALAKHGHKIGDKPSLAEHSKMLFELKALCLDLPEDEYKACTAAQDSRLKEEVPKEFQVDPPPLNATATSRRHLSSYRCDETVDPKGNGRFFVRKETIIYKCAYWCNTYKSRMKDKKFGPIQNGKEYKGKFAMKFKLQREWQENAENPFYQYWLEQKYCIEYDLVLSKNSPRMDNKRRVDYSGKYDLLVVRTGDTVNEKFSAGLTVSGTVPLAIDGGYLDQTLEASGTLMYSRPHSQKKRSISGRLELKWSVGKSKCKVWAGGMFGAQASIEFYLGAATEVGPNGVTVEAFSGVEVVLGGFRSNRVWPTCKCIVGLQNSCKLLFGLTGSGEIKLRLRNIGCQRTPIMDIGLALKASIKVGKYGVDYSNRLDVWKDTYIGNKWNC